MHAALVMVILLIYAISIDIGAFFEVRIFDRLFAYSRDSSDTVAKIDVVHSTVEELVVVRRAMKHSEC